MRDSGERDHNGAPLGERVALVPAQALAHVALAPEQSSGFLAGACEPLAAHAATAFAQAMGRVQTDGPHAAVGKAWSVIKLQYHGGESELAQCARARAIRGALAHAVLLAQCQRACLSTARAKAELVIEPPSARLDGLLVVRAELIGIDNERRHVLERVDDGEAACVERGSVAPTPRREDVVVDLGPAAEPAALQVAHRHAVLDHEIDVGGLEHEAALGHLAEGHKAQPVIVLEDPGVVRGGIGDLFEVALAREHGHARGAHQLGAVLVIDVAHALRRALDLTLQMGTRRGARVRLPTQRQASDERCRARGSAARWGEHEGQVERIEDFLAPALVHVRLGESTHEEGTVALVVALEMPHPLARGQRQLLEGR